MIYNNILIRETIDFKTKKIAWIVKPINKMDKKSRDILSNFFKKNNAIWSSQHKGYIFNYNPAEIIKNMDIELTKKSSYKIIMKNKVKNVTDKIIKYENNLIKYKNNDERRVKLEKKIENAYIYLNKIKGKEAASKKLNYLKSKLNTYKNKLTYYENLIKKEQNKYGFQLDKDSIKCHIKSFGTLIIETEEKIEYWLEVLENEN